MGILLQTKQNLEGQLGVQTDENQAIRKDLQEAKADAADSREMV